MLETGERYIPIKSWKVEDTPVGVGTRDQIDYAALDDLRNMLPFDCDVVISTGSQIGDVDLVLVKEVSE